MRRRLEKWMERLSQFSTYYLLDPIIPVRSRFNAIRLNGRRKYILLLLSGRINRERIDYLYEYLSARDLDFIFYSNHDDPSRNVLQVTFKQGYTSNEIKHVNMLNFVAANLHRFEAYDYFYFLDDDVFFNPDALERYLAGSSFDGSKVHANLVYLEKDPKTRNPMLRKFPRLVYPAGGAGYIVPKRLFASKPRFRFFAQGFADISFGMNVDASWYRDSDLFRDAPKSNDINEVDDVSRYITIHHVRTREVFDQYLERSGLARPQA